ncbi:MAG: GNAT family N-acetyltransferase [Clostridia bacterium]|nr:GNAT family N-acetyltransferase [Clostridia bacterium]
MQIRKCTLSDADKLTELNIQLIEDEQSDNRMTFPELKERMIGFLNTDYNAYFFLVDENIAGYALVNMTANPLYLRQFLIDREYRGKHCGKEAFNMLLSQLGTDEIDLEVLSRNDRGIKFWGNCGFKERSRYMRYTKE